MQVVPVLGRDLCGQCREAFTAWVSSGQQRVRVGITVEDVQRTACDYFGVTFSDLKSPRRHRAVTFPRMIAMYLCRNQAGASFPAIGRSFDKDHSTAVSAVARIQALIQADDRRATEAVTALLEQLGCGITHDKERA